MPWWGVQAGGGEGWVRRAGCRCERGAQDIWHGTQRQARAGTCQKWPYNLPGAHTRALQASASSQPPPSAMPATAATVGLGPGARGMRSAMR